MNFNNGAETAQNHTQNTTYTQGLSRFTTRTFGWMFLGLMVTFFISAVFYASGAWVIMLAIPALPMILGIAELGFVFYLSARINKLSVSMARTLFFIYAVLNGLTFAMIFALYATSTLILVFALTSLFFGTLAGYGYVTKRDLTGLRPIFTVGLIVLFAFWMLSMFINLSAFETVMCFGGLILFMGLTAYDTQKIKRVYAATADNDIYAEKYSIMCALELYLDFINMFLYLLRLISKK